MFDFITSIITFIIVLGILIFIHELGHFLLGHLGSDKSKRTKEVEAEAVSFLVLSYFGVRHEIAQGYIDSWKDKEAVKNVDKFKVMKVVEKIIKAIDKGLGQCLEKIS